MEEKIIAQNVTEDKKPSAFDEILEFFEFLVLCFFIFLLVFSFVFRLITVFGDSMNPTFIHNDRLIVSHLFYEPKNGDVVIANSYGLNETIIKRVIATEGQTLDIDFETGTVTVDGEILTEPYINALTKTNAGAYDYPLVVEDDHVFLLGDNRNASTDSRSPFVGQVHVDDVIGKVILRIFPLSSIEKF